MTLDPGTRRKLAHLTTVDMSLRFLLLNQLEAMQEAGYQVYGLAAPGPWRSELLARGVEVIDIPHLARGRHGWGDLVALWELFRILRRERFDVLHTHTPKAGLLGRVAARLAGQRHVVHTIHGLPSNEHSSRRLQLLSRLVEGVGALLCDHVAVQNAEDLRTVQSWRGVRASRCSLLGNGVDVHRFSPNAVSNEQQRELREELGLPGHALVVGMVARTVWSKGYREFFECARRLKNERSDVEFLCAGPLEPDKSDGVPREIIDDLSRRGVIRYLGVRTDIEKLYAIMDVAVLPSYFPEGVPRGLIEPAAMGKPLVAADNRGCRDVVRDGHNGYLVPPRDPSALTRAVERLLNDELGRERMGRASRSLAEEHFDERLMSRRSLDIYARLLRARRDPPTGGATLRVGSRTPRRPSPVEANGCQEP